MPPSGVEQHDARSSPASSCGTTTISSQARRSSCCEGMAWPGSQLDESRQDEDHGQPRSRRRQRRRRQRESRKHILGQSAHLHARGHRRHPHQVRAWPLPHARLLAVQEDPALGRSDLPARHADALRDRGLSREVRDQDGHRPAGQAADGARHPDLHHRHELRRAVLSRRRSRWRAAPPWPARPPARAKAA